MTPRRGADLTIREVVAASTNNDVLKCENNVLITPANATVVTKTFAPSGHLRDDAILE